MTLATADANGRPSARVVLLKGVDEGFVFYTNYESRKARELAVNPYASLVFLWTPMDRQVRIDGRVEKVSAEESDEYFRQPPPGQPPGGLGFAAEHGRCRAGWRWLRRSRQSCYATARLHRGRRTGAVTGCGPMQSSSGRGAPIPFA